MCLLVYGAGLTENYASPEINNRTGGASIAPATARTITYLTERKWDPKTLPYGKSGLAALAFCEVPLEMNAR